MATDHRDQCIFCQIIAGQAPGHILHRDASTISFLDIAPVNAGHTMVVPLKHHGDMFTLSQAELAAVVHHCQWLAGHIKALCQADGIGIHQLNGAAAGQTVFHYHMHIIPAYLGQTPRVHGRQRAEEQSLAEMAARIREALQRSVASGPGV